MITLSITLMLIHTSEAFIHDKNYFEGGAGANIFKPHGQFADADVN